jgi:hypothetical protein
LKVLHLHYNRDTSYVECFLLNSAGLLTQAGLSLTAQKTPQRLTLLYEEGQTHFRNREWHEAALKFTQITQADAGFRDAARLSATGRRRARWSRSFLDH